MKTLSWLILFCLLPALSYGSGFTLQGKDLITSKETTLKPKEKGLVLVFLSAVCPCSESHVAELIHLHQDFPEFSFYAVHSNQDEDNQAAKTYFESKTLPFPVIRDTKAVLANQYKAAKTPHAFVLNSNGQILYQGGFSNSSHFDKADRNYLREALTDVQNQRPVKTPEGRTLGCIISREEAE